VLRKLGGGGESISDKGVRVQIEFKPMAHDSRSTQYREGNDMKNYFLPLSLLAIVNVLPISSVQAEPGSNSPEDQAMLTECVVRFDLAAFDAQSQGDILKWIIKGCKKLVGWVDDIPKVPEIPKPPKSPKEPIRTNRVIIDDAGKMRIVEPGSPGYRPYAGSNDLPRGN